MTYYSVNASFATFTSLPLLPQFVKKPNCEHKVDQPARVEGRVTGSSSAKSCSGMFNSEKLVLFVMSVPRILNT